MTCEIRFGQIERKSAHSDCHPAQKPGIMRHSVPVPPSRSYLQTPLYLHLVILRTCDMSSTSGRHRHESAKPVQRSTSLSRAVRCTSARHPQHTRSFVYTAMNSIIARHVHASTGARAMSTAIGVRTFRIPFRPRRRQNPGDGVWTRYTARIFLPFRGWWRGLKLSKRTVRMR